MAGGTGSTYEKGETKDSETQDHARTGFAQNLTQYTTKETKDEYYKKFTHSEEDEKKLVQGRK